MFLPIKSKKGFTASNVSLGPPTMIVSVPAFAPTSPPDTGASRYFDPSALIFVANSFVAIGEIELMSTTTWPLPRPLATPFSPNRTRSTSGVSGTMMKMNSDCSATSLADAHCVAPPSISAAGTELRPCTNN